MTARELADAIINNVSSGLKGAIGNFSYSREQVEKEVGVERNAIIKEYSVKNIIPKKDLVQTIRCIPVVCDDISKCCDGMESGVKVRQFKLPRLSTVFKDTPIDFIGTIDRKKDYKVYFDKSYLNHQFRRYTSKKPYVWIDMGSNDENGDVTAYLFNANLQEYMSVTAVFEDPYHVIECDCLDPEDKEFPAPQFIQRDIIVRISERYVRYHKQLIPQVNLPNTQTSQGTA